MQFTSEAVEKGVAERGFELTVAGERVPGIVWAPENAQGPRPLVLIGHGGTQHKRTENVLATARRLVRRLGYAVAAIDAPAHGDRTTPEETERARAELMARMESRTSGWSPDRSRTMTERAAKAVPEWRATLDAMQGLEYVGTDGPVGYWGVSMGTAIGVPFLAAEPRVRAAVLGLAGLRAGADDFEQAARRITIPLLFLFQWNDELATRESGLALFDALGAKDKTMHINPGGHTGIPAHERDAWDAFFTRHLGTTPSSHRGD